MTLTLEQSFKKRLQLIAKERQMTPAEIWQNLVLERFLARLCQSSYRSNFILKGGVLLARHVPIGRETRDLDFSITNMSSNINELSKALEEIIAIDLKDGFEFKNLKAESLDHFHTHYPGILIQLDVCFSKSRTTLFIDLGFGDHVEIKEEDMSLLANSKGPLFEASIPIKCYPIEFVFAEKIETVIHRGADNSRMKDFHDLFTMIVTKDAIDRKETQKAMTAVFNHRGTALALPLTFDSDALQTLQYNWKRYHSTMEASSILPGTFEEVLSVINHWLGC